MESHTCLNCSNTFTGHYCNNCGEKVYSPHDKSVGHLFEEVTHFLTHFEGTFFRSMKAIFTRPGLLAYDYCRGLRKKYFKPVSLYILLVVIYLVFPLFQGLNMQLGAYKTQKLYGPFAEKMILDKQAHKGISYEELSHKFEKKSEKISKIMLIVILPLCALVLMSLWRRKNGYYFFDHFILSAEINSFFLITLFFIVPILLMLIYLLAGTTLLNSQEGEDILIPAALLLQTFYVSAAFRRMYQSGAAEAIFKALVFTIMQFLIVFIIYKFLLFITTMALI